VEKEEEEEEEEPQVKIWMDDDVEERAADTKGSKVPWYQRCDKGYSADRGKLTVCLTLPPQSCRHQCPPSYQGFELPGSQDQCLGQGT
jgi:hypothetical protein